MQLLFASIGQDQPTLISPRNLVMLGDGARLDLIESHVALGGGRNLTNLVNRIVVGRGAQLRHDRLQQGDVAGSLIGRTTYRIAADARLTQSLATLGGGLVRNETLALIDGSGIELQLNGLYLTRGRQHVDNTIRVDHAKPGSVSDQFYKGVLDGESHAVFAGKIVVRRDAQKTNAYQANNNLLLSPDVEIDTKPELEIFADDVKCSHGATSGELDERELFYLRSRGLDPGHGAQHADLRVCRRGARALRQSRDRRPGQARAGALAAGRGAARRAGMNELAVPVRAGLDVEAVRADFPCLDQMIHDRPLVFLDSATSAQKPKRVIDTLTTCCGTTTPTSTAACTR